MKQQITLARITTQEAQSGATEDVVTISMLTTSAVLKQVHAAMEL